MHDNIAKKRSKSLVIPTGKTTDHMAFKFFPDTTLLLKVDHFEGILNCRVAYMEGIKYVNLMEISQWL